MDLIYKDGHSYFMPAPIENRISGVCKWEQAFCVYATMYSQVNPNRSAEIWQYVHTINTAASAYVWKNVSNYDVTFRHLMAQYPQRSWAKIYNQMWSLSMRELIQRNFNQNQNSASANHGKGGKNSNGKGGKHPNYCWSFNKGQCKDPKCHFVNHCSYCDDAGHGLHNCPKAKEANA